MWMILQHVAWEGPGLVADALRARSLPFRIVRLDRGEAVPSDPAAMDGLIVMGGTMGVYEAAQFPFLAREVELLAAAVAHNLPVLGICLGSQLLAAALGAEVTRGPILEIGEGEVHLTSVGREDPVLGPGSNGSVPVVHWHQDTFPLPSGTVLLASTDLYAQQAFRAGHRAYGFQFHPEVDANLAAAWAPRGLLLSPDHQARVADSGIRLLDRFLDVTSS